LSQICVITLHNVRNPSLIIGSIITLEILVSGQCRTCPRT